MNMNKILQNFEDAATGEYTPSKQESSDMKMILESFYNVAQEDAGETAPQQLDEIASVTMSGDSADEVAQLVKLMNDAGAPEAAPVGPQPTTMPAPVDIPADGPPDMPPMVTPKMMDDFDAEEEPVEEGDAKEIMHRKAEGMDRKDFVADAGEMGMTAEEAGEFWDAVNGETESYENEPDERYNDHETMTHDLSGGINRRKKSYKRAEPGDNPMAVESSLAEELSSMLKNKMSEKKNAKPDYLDLDGDGDTKEPMKKAAKDKEAAKDQKKNKEIEVGEAGKMKGGGDDPCWKGYKMVGTKKKGGKEVPNCVPREGVEEAAPKNNPVAKNAGKFNKAKVEPDKKKLMKKGKGVKHKGKDFAMESAPVFDRYVKPIINKTPKQMVEFYDREARTIINRLSKERRSLAETNSNTKMHDVVIGRLRENLDVVSEAPYRRRSRSSFDIGRTGYGDGRGANLGSDKAAFKRREMEVELGDEEPNNYAVSIGGKPWKVFRSQRQAEKAAATIKNKYGKDTKVFQTAAPPSS